MDPTVIKRPRDIPGSNVKTFHRLFSNNPRKNECLANCLTMEKQRPTLHKKGHWESNINVNVQSHYFQNRIIMFCLPIPNSYICDRFIYFQDRSVYFAAAKYEEGSWWDWSCTISCLGIHKLNFRYSPGSKHLWVEIPRGCPDLGVFIISPKLWTQACPTCSPTFSCVFSNTRFDVLRCVYWLI